MNANDLASERALAERHGAAVSRRVGRSHAAGFSPRGRWWRDATRRRLLALADVVVGCFATLIVVGHLEGGLWALVFLPMWPLLAKLLGLYDRDHRSLRHLTADEVPVIFAWVGTATALVALLLPLTPAGTLNGLEICELLVVGIAAAIGLRSLTRWAWWRRTPPELVGVVGDGDALDSVHRKFKMFRKMHLEFATELRIGDLGTGPRRTAELSYLADGVDRIVVAATGVERELIGELKALCRQRAVKLSVVSPLRGNALPSEPFSRFGDLPILEYNTWDRSRSTVLIKRLFDVLVALAGLVILAPILIAIAIGIKLDSRGPVLFSQIRAGLNGRPFRMYKLRTMSVDAEARLDGLVDFTDLDEPMFKFRDDPRVTRFGRILRRFSIDEVPQLFNVLTGEMSIVGPRPEQVELVARYEADARLRLTAKPGITGPMQIFGRGELTFSERLAVELEYVDNPSLARDLKIIIHTLPAVFRGTGAY
jgi:exopolysaccharide biosynthesis polyprenyl glycosylphosphotransferase